MITTEDLEFVYADLCNLRMIFDKVTEELLTQIRPEHMDGDLHGFYKRHASLGGAIDRAIGNLEDMLPGRNDTEEDCC